MSINKSQHCKGAPELTGVMTGSNVAIGTLLHPPVQIIFDNQGAAAVAISDDNFATTWRTFPAGEALVLDMRGNKGIADNFSWSTGTVFSGNGASGTFSISYTYALEL